MTWTLNGHPYAYPAQFYKAGIFDLDFQIFPRSEVKFRAVSHFRDEMKSSLAELLEQANGRKIAVLLSGIDSESIAILLHELKAEFECWHLAVPGRGLSDIETLREIERSLDTRVHIVPFSWTRYRSRVYSTVVNTGIIATMMHALWGLIEQIPSDRYLICGNGAFRKMGKRFMILQQRLRDQGITNRGRAIPIDGRDILLRVLAQHNRRQGEFYFHSRSDRQVAALFKDPLMHFDPETGEIDDKRVFLEYFPEAKFRAKTEPWSNSKFALRKEQRIVNLLQKKMSNAYMQWTPSHQFLFAPLYVDEIFQ